MRTSILLILFTWFSLLGCKEVSQKVLPPVDDRLGAWSIELSPYVKDQSLDFFIESSWYSYYDTNHIIWPHFRVYGLRINGEYTKLQIIDYYDDFSNPGNFTLRVQKEGEATKLIDFNAQGCGNVYTNPTYKECMADPDRNAFTYLNLETGAYRLMSDEEALKHLDWHIAFNGTNVRINSGKYGPGDVRATTLYIYGSFFANGKIYFQKIAEESFGPKGIRFFEQSFNLRRAPYALPQGQERAIHETDWFESNGEFFQAVNKNWWIVEGAEAGAFTKFNVSEIEEQKVGDQIETLIKLTLFNQKAGDSSFGTEESWELPKFDTSKRLIKSCLDLHGKQILSCSDNRVDLILSISNRNGLRRWRFNVIKGAVGPLNHQEMTRWTSGL